MYINFESIAFKNLLSYGSSETKIIFNKGINGIIGKNGKGKSTIIDAMSYCLFGKPYRNIKIDDLVNRYNKKGLWTQCVLYIDRTKYVITRSIKPSKISIEMNGEELDLLSSKRLIQEEIDRILGIDHNLFRQIICLSVNYNKPFLSLKSNEKRDIVEKIFNIRVFGDMLKNLKKEQVGLKTQAQINNKSLSILTNNLKTLKKQSAQLQSTTQTFESDKERDLNKVLKDIKNLEEEIQKNKNNISLLEKKIAGKTVKNVSKIEKTLKDVEKLLNNREFEVKQLQKTKENLKTISSCPTCFSDIDDNHRDIHVKEIDDKLKSFSKTIEIYTEERNKIKKDLEESKEIEKEINQYNNDIDNENYRLNLNEKQLKGLNEQKKQIENRKLDFDMESFNKDFEEKKQEYIITFKESKQLNDDIIHNDIISNILSENGIKAHFFKKLLPVLNTKINYYLDIFDLPVVMKFNSLMEERITDMAGKYELPYMGFSEGEKKRIDLAILLSLISTTKSISNWNCNTIFFDELFDSATDNDGLDKILGTIKNMVKVESKDLCVYIISHRLNDEDFFNQKLEIFKNGLYSKIVKS